MGRSVVAKVEDIDARKVLLLIDIFSHVDSRELLP
jgi:hypothetical protein